jgi:hypothetical protein
VALTHRLRSQSCGGMRLETKGEVAINPPVPEYGSQVPLSNEGKKSVCASEYKVQYNRIIQKSFCGERGLYRRGRHLLQYIVRLTTKCNMDNT